MQDHATREQLALFQKQLTWCELPKEARELTINFFAAMCIDIVTEQQSTSKEQPDEPS